MFERRTHVEIDLWPSSLVGGVHPVEIDEESNFIFSLDQEQVFDSMKQQAANWNQPKFLGSWENIYWSNHIYSSF